jgi:RimJ/RimL family protein N-acetyltransferase
MIVETTREDHASLCQGRAPRRFENADSPIAPVEVLQMLADLAEVVRESFSPAAWLIVEDNEVVGLCSVKAPPSGGVIDIGYGVAPTRQNRGIAGRAIGEIVAWARKVPQVRAVTAETTPANFASQRVLERNGFVKVGKRVDEEDGPVLCWRCPTD